MNEEVMDLAELVRDEVSRQQSHQLLVVESVREDGTVNLQFGEEILDAIPCNQSYVNRKDGDVVLVVRHSAGWRVMDKIGAPYEPAVPDGVDLTFGTSALPSEEGFSEGGRVWVKDGAIYVQTIPAGGGGEGGGTSTPKPITLQPSSRSGYRSGSRDGDSVRQGAWQSYPKAWTGAWFYGTAIEDACRGKSLEKMEVWVSRTSARHGVSGKTTPRLGTHTHPSRTNPTPSLSNRWNGPGLGLGQAAWIQVPGSAANPLSDGSARGIGISAGVGNDYLVATDNSGTVRLTFR